MHARSWDERDLGPHAPAGREGHATRADRRDLWARRDRGGDRFRAARVGEGEDAEYGTGGPAPAPSEIEGEAEAAARALDAALVRVTTPGSTGPNVLEAARLIDATLARLARRGAALQLEMGQTLVALSTAGHRARLNVSSIFDFAREELGLRSSRARRLFRIAEAAPRRPLLHEAVLQGTVDLCKAEVVLPVAVGGAEAAWVHLAHTQSVDELARLVRSEGHAVPEAYRSALLSATAEQRGRFEAALEVARFTQPGRTRARRLEVLAQEYLGGFGAPECFVASEALAEPLAPFWEVVRGAPGLERALASAAAQWGPGIWEDLAGGRVVTATRAADGDAPGAPTAAPVRPPADPVEPRDAAPEGGAAEGTPGASGSEEEPKRPADDAPSLPDGPCTPALPSDGWQRTWRMDFMRHAFDIDATLAALAASVDGGPAPPALRSLGPAPSTDALRTHARRLGALMSGWSEQMGQLLLVVRERRLWRLLGFASFTAYCRDRLRIEPRTARYHIHLEEQMRRLPALRQALRDARLTFSQAELLARHATADNVEAAIAEAEDMTHLDLQRLWEERERRRLAGEDPGQPGEGNVSESEADAAGQEEDAGEDAPHEDEGNASETGQVKLEGTESTLQLIEDALLTARIVAWLDEGRVISPGEALGRVGDHFVDVWRSAVPDLRGKKKRLLDRTGGTCAVPGCTAPWQETHHIVFRSRGGSDEVWNLHPLCWFHHHQSLHAGHMRLRGRAGELLVWELTTSLEDMATFIETGTGAERRVRRVKEAA